MPMNNNKMFENINIRKTLIIFITLFSCFALLTAFTSQYYFKLDPCKLCLYQRYPYLAIFILGLTYLIFFSKKEKMLAIFFYVIGFLIAIECLIAGYHMLVEYGVINEIISCQASNLFDSINDEVALREFLTNAPALSCKDPAFKFILSMAGWNFVFSLSVSIAWIIVIVKQYRK